MSSTLPSHHDALLEQAAILFEGDCPDEAIEILDELHSRYPSHIGVGNLYLASALELEDYECALSIAHKLQEQQLTPEVRIRVGWAYGGAGFPALALHQLNLLRDEKLSYEASEDFDALKENVHKSLSEYPSGLTRGSNFAVAIRWERAELALQQQNYAEAARLAEALVFNLPDLYVARATLAICKFALGEIEEARDHASAAISLTDDKCRMEFVLALCESLLDVPFSPIVSSPAPDSGDLDVHLQTLVIAGETARAAEYLGRVTEEMISANSSARELLLALGFLARATGDHERLAQYRRLFTSHGFELLGDVGDALMPYFHIVPSGIFEDLEPPFLGVPRVSAALREQSSRYGWFASMGKLLAQVSDQSGVELALSILDEVDNRELAESLVDVASSNRFSFDFRELLAGELGERGKGSGVVLQRREFAVPFAWGTLQVFEGPLPGETPEILATVREAMQLSSQGRYKRAESIIRQKIEEDGASAQLWNVVSEILVAAEDFEEAYGIWLQIAEEFPEDAVSRLKLAQFALDHEDIDQAEELARGIFSAGPLPFHELSNCAYFLLQLGLARRDVALAQDALHYLQDNPPQDPESLDAVAEAELEVLRLTERARRTR